MSVKSSISVAALAAISVAHAASAQITMDWSTVGNALNTPDSTTGFGAVGYEYRIGTYEVTNAQYAAFLNAVAASDPNGLYNPIMGADPRGGITRSGSDGSYTYSVKANMGNKPVNYVSWYDAARMANWMTNGQGGGSGDTESGVYTFDGVNSISAITRNLTNPNQVFIPTEDEWYKAAYHQPFAPGGVADDFYWLYATRSSSVPAIASATSIGDVANPGHDVVNYLSGADWNGQDGNATTVGSAGSTTFYGAFDMNGNVWEWNETLIGGSVLRGGSFDDLELTLRSSFRFLIFPSTEGSNLGFRLASPAAGPMACNAADLAPPYGTLDFFDVLAFLQAFADQNPAADLNADGQFDFFDVIAFLGLVDDGCP